MLHSRRMPAIPHQLRIRFNLKTSDSRELNRWIELHHVACWVENVTDQFGETIFWDYRIDLDYMIVLARQGVPRFRLFRPD
jgi:hypothetical protein